MIRYHNTLFRRGLLLALLLAALALPARAQVFSSGLASCAILEDGTLTCWGYNGVGLLGQGDTDHRGDDPDEMGEALPPIDLGAGRTATAVAGAYTHACALLDDGSVTCWGNNSVGQLGQGDTDHRGDDPEEMGDDLPAIDLGAGRTATTIATGANHTCALLDDGSVKCWGYNFFSQLGQGDTEHRGNAAGEMGDDLPPIDLGTGRTATAIAAGNFHTCALLDDASVKCWGNNGNGQLGQGDTEHRGNAADEMGDNLPAIDLGTGRTATAIAAGTAHTCALLDDASVKCWGYNEYGQLGQGDTAHRGDDPEEMGDDLPAIDLGTERTATAIATGNYHTCALFDDASVTCWGYNNSGQLGQGDTNHRGDDPGEMGDNLPAIDLGTGRTATAIAAGLYLDTCALLDDASLKCWGDNGVGQLGQGDTNHRGDDPGEMGDDLPAIDLGGPGGVIPVELTTFTALTDGTAATLHWQTASETSNAGFEVQHQPPTAETFAAAGFVEGHGSTTEPQAYQHTVTDLAPGTHRFRLKQIDFDGAFEYSPEIDVAIELPGTHALDAYPNPFNPATTIVLTLAHTQPVHLSVYDLLGRQVALLHDGVLEADEAHVFRFDATSLPSGLYVLRITGDQINDARQLHLVK